MLSGSKKFIGFLASARLALLLIILTTITILIGVTSDKSSISEDLSVPPVYSSPVFQVLILLLLLNLSLCTWRQMRGLRGRQYSLAKLGTVVLHIGLILVITGALLDFALGMTGILGIMEGRSFTDRHNAYKLIREGVFRPEKHDRFELVLNKAKVSYNPTGTEAQGDISFFRDGVEVKRAWVSKSNILSYGNTHIYLIQNGYYAAVIMKDKNGRELARDLIGLTTEKSEAGEQYREKISLAGNQYTGWLEFYPDYDGFGKNRSYEPKNPVLKASVNSQTGDRLQPVYQGVISVGETQVFKDGTSLTFYTFVPWLSFYAKVEPGLYVIYLGFIVCFIGMVLLYAFNSRSNMNPAEKSV